MTIQSRMVKVIKHANGTTSTQTLPPTVGASNFFGPIGVPKYQVISGSMTAGISHRDSVTRNRVTTYGIGWASATTGAPGDVVSFPVAEVKVLSATKLDGTADRGGNPDPIGSAPTIAPDVPDVIPTILPPGVPDPDYPEPEPDPRLRSPNVAAWVA